MSMLRKQYEQQLDALFQEKLKSLVGMTDAELMMEKYNLLRERYFEVCDDNFKLAAYQCHNPISDDYGHMLCKDVQYWKERCRLAEVYLKPGRNDYEEHRDTYNTFLTDNGNKPY